MSSPLVVTTITSKLFADVDAGPKIEGHASKSCLFWLFCSSPGKYADGVSYNTGSQEFIYFDISGAADVKAAAAYDAVTKSKADVIIAPQYVLETTNYLVYKSWDVTVTGYLGTIRGFAKDTK